MSLWRTSLRLRSRFFDSVLTDTGAITWTMVEGDADSLPQPNPYGIESDGQGGFYAVGPGQGLWTSPDGVSWSVDPAHADLNFLGVEQTIGDWALAGTVEGGFLLLERRSSTWTEVALPEPIVWTGELDLLWPVPVQSGNRVLIPEPMTGTAWLSVEGAPFMAVQAPEPLNSVVAIPTRGFAFYTGVSDPDNVTAIHYTSPDGVTWSMQDPLPFVTGDVVEYEVVRSGDTLVALLAKQRGCSVWRSVDGIIWVAAYDYANTESECWDHTGFGISARSSESRGREVSTDNGQTWVWVNPPINTPLGGGVGIAGFTGDVVYLLEGRDGIRRLWIARFDTP